MNFQTKKKKKNKSLVGWMPKSSVELEKNLLIENKMQVKKLNSKGNERYKDLVKTLIQSKLDEKDYVPIKELIEDNRYTEPLENGGDISPKKFSTRLDMGKYLGEILSDCKISKIEMDENLWHWLSGYFIKQILTKSSGKENIRYIWNRRNRASRRFLVELLGNHTILMVKIRNFF